VVPKTPSCPVGGSVLGRTRRVHFVGIGGIGMSGIAELLANLGYAVSGSDEKRSVVTDRMRTMGITVSVGHDARHVGDADVVVISSAVRPTNPEVVEAARRQIPVIPRAEMLAELMRLRFAIAVAGAHGKTTTTSMIAVVLERAGLDPTAVIGGRLSAFGSNARLGRGELMVAEADESDRSFLKLFPSIAVITNIDREHLENYGGFDDLCQAFVDFANKVPFYGAVVACVDDSNLAAILPRVARRVMTYGLDSPDAQVTAGDIRLAPLSVTATIKRRQRAPESPATGPGGAGDDTGAGVTTLGRLILNVPGRHNLQNALAAVAVGLELGLPFERIADGLREFRGAERRFEVRGEPNGILVVDDYGHHPTEIRAVLDAARTLERRVVVAFQPHRFTRTAQLLHEFGPALAGADAVVLTDIYPAGEDPIPGATIDALAEVIRHEGLQLDVVPRLADVPDAIARLCRPGDLVITLGAGSIGAIPERVIEAIESRGRTSTAQPDRATSGKPTAGGGPS
jgi:UDP-N-acetylmuramate--alanine ligase